MPEPAATAQDLNAVARGIFVGALADCSIDRAFQRKLTITRTASGACLSIDGEEAAMLDRLKRVRIVSIGKAATPMLTSLLARLPLPRSCDVQGILIAPSPPETLPAGFQYFAGGHPLPNPASLHGASSALAMLQAVSEGPPADTLCVFLISGGASAMMELPLDASISLGDTVDFYRALVHCGATIVEINCVRKHFSAVKGGRLALAAGRAQKISLFVSDVPPARLDALASGPTIPDPGTLSECREIIERYQLANRFPAPVRSFFESPSLPETPKPGGLESRSWKLLDSDELARAAQLRANELGFHPVIDSTCDDWTYDAAARYLLERMRQLRTAHPRLCLISPGEVTVEVPATASAASGGRNQHLALYLATQLRETDAPLSALSAGSDGVDGNSSAAGAVVDPSTLLGMEKAAQQALAAFDSSTLLHRLGATIVTGPTGHNLRDLRILLAG